MKFVIGKPPPADHTINVWLKGEGDNGSVLLCIGTREDTALVIARISSAGSFYVSVPACKQADLVPELCPSR